jgi:hypothetical protein
MHEENRADFINMDERKTVAVSYYIYPRSACKQSIVDRRQCVRFSLAYSPAKLSSLGAMVSPFIAILAG